LAASSLLLWNSVEQRHEIVHHAQAAAEETVRLFDREALAATSLLAGLASSPALRARDLPGTYEQLTRTAIPNGAWIVVWDLQTQLINTARPFGTPLPKLADFPDHRASLARLERERISVSNRVRSQVEPADLISVSLRTDDADGAMNGALTLVIPGSRLSVLMNEQSLPAEWSSSLLDRRLQHLATTGAVQSVFGDTLPDDLLREMNANVGGTFRARDGSGSSFLYAVHRSRSGFTGVARVPAGSVDEPLDAALRQIGVGAVALHVLRLNRQEASERPNDRGRAPSSEADLDFQTGNGFQTAWPNRAGA
jgi:hypothetical protein